MKIGIFFYTHTHDSVYIYQCIYHTCVLRGVVETVTIIAVSHFLFGFCRRVYISSSPPPPPPPPPPIPTLQISVFILSNIVGYFLNSPLFL